MTMAQPGQQIGEEAKEPSLGPLQNLFGYHFRRAWNVLRKDFEQAVQDLGVRQVQIGVLSVICANPGINQGVVGRLLDIQRANMVSLIGELVEAGWVLRAEDPGDRRAIALSLTPAGNRLLAEALDRIEGHEARLLASLDEADRDRLRKILRILGDNAPSASDPEP